MEVSGKRYLTIILAVVFLLLFSPRNAHADSVTIDTSPLVGSSAGPFAVLVALEDSSMSASMTNTATLTNFDFGGGSAGSAVQSGGATGNLSSGITLMETQPSGINFLVQDFTPGSTLSFDFSMTTNANPGLNPQSGLTGDEFLFFILDDGGNNFVQTTDGSTPDAFLTATVCPSCSNGLSIQQFALPTPAASTPEPSTLLLLGSGILVMGLRRRVLRQRPAQIPPRRAAASA